MEIQIDLSGWEFETLEAIAKRESVSIEALVAFFLAKRVEHT